MKEAKKALETSSLGRNPRFSLSQLIQSVVMTSTTTEVKVNRTLLKRERKMLKNSLSKQKGGWGECKIALIYPANTFKITACL